MAIPKACERCGGPVAWLRTEDVAEEYRCTRCSHLMLIAPEQEGGQPEPLVEVEVVWRTGHPSLDEAVAVRKLLPHLGHLSPRELIRTFAACSRLDIGRHHRSEAKELQAQGRALGLDVRLAA